MRQNHTEKAESQEELCETHSIGKRTREWIVTPQASPTLAEHGIFLCGWSEARLGFVFIRPRPAMHQVLVCASGQGEVWQDGAWQDCGPGMAYLTPAHVFHAYRCREEVIPAVPWCVYWVAYHAPLIEGKQPLLLNTEAGPLSAAIRNLYFETHGVADQDTISRWTHLVHTCAERTARPVTGDPRLHRLWRMVMNAPDHAWSMEILAGQAGISSEHLRRLCQKELECAPMEHVTHLRMQYAVSLFASGNYSVAAVAERVGYSNPFAFSAAFKRVLGIPPSQYAATKLLPSR